MATFQEANDIAVQQACQNPLWTVQSGYTDPPDNAAAGVNVAATVAAAYKIVLRPRDYSTAGTPAYPGRQVVITVDVVDDTATYTVSVNGIDCDYTATSGDETADVLAGILAAIVASGPASDVVAGVITSPSGVPTLTLTGISWPDWSVGAATTGTGALTLTADPTSASARFWCYPVAGPGNNTPAKYAGQSWELADGLPSIPITSMGASSVMSVNFASQLYVELFDVTGAGDSVTAPSTLAYAARVVIGPAQVS